jgi:hypothetical protein
MASIPIASLRGVNQAQEPNRADSQAAGAVYGGLANLGQGIAQVGDTLGQIAMDRQMHVNKGILANEDLIRQNTFAEVEKFTAANKGNPEAWDAYAKEKWTEYEDGRQQRMQTEGWGPAVREQDLIDKQQFSARADRVFETEKNKALIRQSNARLDSLAQNYANAGDYETAAKVIRETDRYDDEKDAMVQSVINGGIYAQFDRRLTDISTLPNAQQVQALAAVEADLVNPESGMVKDKDGKVVGGLGQSGRNDLIRQARSRIRAAEGEMAQVGRSLVRQAEIGVDPAMAFKSAMESGQITEEVARIFVPEVNDALAKKQAIAEEKATKEAERTGIRRDRAELAAERMIDARTGATLTMDEIERREARGITRPNDPTGLTADAANRLRERLRAVEEGDIMAPDFLKVNERLEDMLGQGVMGTWLRDSAQMEPAEKTRILEKINAAKISTGAKLKLVDKFFEVQKWDLREGEISDKDGDRDIGPEEKELRTAMIETYRSAGGSLGPRAIGSRYMADMHQVSDWFRANEGASPQAKQAKAKEFYAKVRKSVDDEASTAILRTIPLFQ